MSTKLREPMVMGYAHSTQNMPANSLVSTQQHGIVTTISKVLSNDRR